MYLRDLITSLGRRWYLVLVGLAATCGIAVLIFGAVPVSYDARASMVLLPPKNSVSEGGNPYLNLSGLGQALDILARRLDSDAVRTPIEDTIGGTFVAVPDATTSGPILAIEGSGDSEKAALAMTKEVIAAVPVALTSLQTELNVPDFARITAMTITADTEATLNQRVRIQATLAAAGAGLAATILLTGFIDGRLMARRLLLASTPKPLGRKAGRLSRQSPSRRVGYILKGRKQSAGDDDGASEPSEETPDRDELLVPGR
jgi:hypothetical protein